MKHFVIETCRSLFSLLRFLFWYALVMVIAFYLLPDAAVHLQAQYESLNELARYSLMLVMIILVASWGVLSFRSRNRSVTEERAK